MYARVVTSSERMRMVGESRVTVRISDFAVCRTRGSWLSTYALGSCVAIALYDPVHHVGGLLHFMLPDSSLNPAKAAARPGMFADTGFAGLMDALREERVPRQNLVARIAGGGNLQGLGTRMDIGAMNQQMARKLLSEAGIRLAAEDVGGQSSRSVFLHIGTGQVVVRSPSGEAPL